MDNKVAAILILSGSMAMVGLISIFTRNLLDLGYNALDIAFIRLIIATAVLLAVILARCRECLRVGGRDLLFLAVFGVFKFLMDYSFNESLDSIHASLATVLQNTAPYFVVILSYFLLREKTTKTVILSIMIGTFGCALMTGTVMSGTELDVMGIVFALISAASLGMYFIGSDMNTKAGRSPVTYLFYVLLVATIVSVPFADLGKIASRAMEPDMIWNSLALGVGMTLIPFYVMTWSSKYLDAPTVSMICVLEVLFAAVVDVFYFKVDATVEGLIGMVLMIASVVMISRESVKGGKDLPGTEVRSGGGPRDPNVRHDYTYLGCSDSHLHRTGVYKMDAQEMRDTFVNFFKERGHAYISSASLIPENDPTVLFTTAGMHPLVPYLLGEKHPAGKRLVDFQKCVRTGDIDEVGDASHLTFFEMLGNWSLGDYFKKESIEFSYDLLTDVLGIRPDQLAVTAFAGDEDAPKDTETADLWKSHGLRDDQIYFYPKSDNWWGPAGQTGPCGPDTEIFYDDGRPKCGPDCGPSCHCGKFTEIWNNVFMQYNKNADGTFSPLKQKNVDTGMGLERMLRILNGDETVYDTPLFAPIIAKIGELTGKRYGEDEDDTRAFRIIADHMRAATFILGDGVVPAKIGQGYILRRLIRRSSRYMSKLGYEEPFMQKIAEVIVQNYSAAYPELERNKDFIYTNISNEELKFHKAVMKGLRRFDQMVAENGDSPVLNGETVFRLYDTYGFPIEMTVELAAEKGLKVDMDDFNGRFKTHQDKSRGDGGTFKGGLADHSEETTKLHTATHLLNAALRKFVSPDIHQKGSNITAERLRFDFNLDRKVTPEELKEIEDWVNECIKAEIPVVCEEMPYEQAKAEGVEGVFTSKYGEIVKVYKIGDVSAEMCGGPHVKNTKELQGFRIKKEESSAAGIRRIKAVVGNFD